MARITNCYVTERDGQTPLNGFACYFDTLQQSVVNAAVADVDPAASAKALQPSHVGRVSTSREKNADTRDRSNTLYSMVAVVERDRARAVNGTILNRDSGLVQWWDSPASEFVQPKLDATPDIAPNPAAADQDLFQAVIHAVGLQVYPEHGESSIGARERGCKIRVLVTSVKFSAGSNKHHNSKASTYSPSPAY
jgi:hypothetical protein